MQVVASGRLTLAATDLGRFLSCRHLTALDLEVAKGMRKKPPVYPDPFMELLQKRGFAHEKEFNEKVEASGAPVLDIGGVTNRNAVEETLAAMRAGRPAISQGVLSGDSWFGVPDLLLKVDPPSRLGPWSYEAWDTKLARETRGSTPRKTSLIVTSTGRPIPAPHIRPYVLCRTREFLRLLR